MPGCDVCLVVLLTALVSSTPIKHRSSDKGKKVERPGELLENLHLLAVISQWSTTGRSSAASSSLPFMASAPITGALPVTPTPSSSNRADVMLPMKTTTPRRTFGDVIGKNRVGQSQSSSNQSWLGGKDIVTQDDVTYSLVRDIPTKSEVMYPDLQDPLLALFYVDLPPLR